MKIPVDHLIYAAPTLEAGMDRIEELLGVRPVYGGQHLGRGTHNALLSLGSGTYLEVIAPDPAQPHITTPLWIAADSVSEPRLIYWAARATGLEGLVEKAQSNGLALGAVSSGSRTHADGQILNWMLTDPRANPAEGVIPFFIDWKDTPHPSGSLPAGGALLALEARHPKANEVKALLQIVGIEMEIKYGPEPVLMAGIKSKQGEVWLY